MKLIVKKIKYHSYELLIFCLHIDLIKLIVYNFCKESQGSTSVSVYTFFVQAEGFLELYY